MSSIKHALEIIVRAFWEVYSKRVALFRSVFFHSGILAVCSFLIDKGEQYGLWVLWALIPVVYSYTLIAISTHRIILLNPADLPQWGIYRFTNREFRFCLFGLGIGLICMPPALLTGIPLVGYPLSLLGIAYLSGRLSLVLPATAIDEKWSLQDAWDRSRKHQLMMAIIVFIFPFIVGLPETWISHIPYSIVLVFLISIVTTIFTIAALSLAFEGIRADGLSQNSTLENGEEPE